MNWQETDWAGDTPVSRTAHHADCTFHLFGNDARLSITANDGSWAVFHAFFTQKLLETIEAIAHRREQAHHVVGLALKSPEETPASL